MELQKLADKLRTKSVKYEVKMNGEKYKIHKADKKGEKKLRYHN